MKTLIIIAVCNIIAQPVLAQKSSQGTRSLSVSHMPDTNSPFELAELAVNPTVAREIGLGSDGYVMLQKALSKSKGLLNGGIVFGKVDGSTNFTSRLEQHKRIREENARLIDELFSPAQVARLRQIAFQIEVCRLGWATSLCNGNLGAQIDIHENQKDHITSKAKQYEERASEEISKVLAKLQADMLSELSAEQRQKASEVMGKPFYFRDDFFKKAIPDAFDK